MPLSVFDGLADRATDSGLYWLLEFASLLFGTWTAMIIGVLLAFIVSKIPNQMWMGICAVFLHLGLVYLCLDATLWRSEVPAGVGYPVLATLTLVALILVTWWLWEASHRGKSKS